MEEEMIRAERKELMKFSKTKIRALMLFILAIASYLLVFYVYSDLINSPELPQVMKLAYKATPFLGVFIAITMLFNEYAADKFEETAHEKRSENQNQSDSAELLREDRNR